MRKGLLPLIGARRGPGMAILNEDVAFPRERLAEAITDLHALFARFGVRDAVVFGHAKDGNLHFIAPQDFRGEKNVRNYEAFMDALAEMVVGKYDGALKAEHGTGTQHGALRRARVGSAPRTRSCARSRPSSIRTTSSTRASC